MATKHRSAQSEKNQYQRQRRQYGKRFRVLILLSTTLFVVLMGRLFYIQVVNANDYQSKAKHLRAQSVVMYNRGRILDRNGVVLAQDEILYDVFAHPRYYYKLTPADLAEKLSPVLHIPKSKLIQKLSLPYDTISVKKNISKSLARQIQKLGLSGIETPRKMLRRYPQSHLASHILGFVNDDASISTGIEKTSEKTLRTPPEIPKMELDGHGDFINVHHINSKLVTDFAKADDVHLTIDARVQYAAESALAKGLAASKAKRGTVIILNPRNGEILAFAVSPDFDPEQYYKTPAENLKNWAITDVYPPGSTFKILTIASGLESGVINRYSRIHDTGILKMGGFTIKNYDYTSHGAPGDIDLVYLFQHSSNIGSLLVSLMMDPAEHYKLIHQFGLGEKTNIDIPGESRGILHTPDKWDQLTHGTIGFGYGLAATPIQVASAVAAIANDGIWITPHLLKNETNIVKRRVLSEKTSRTVTDLLTESIETAKTSTVRLQGFHLAGKTGTSRKPSADGKGYSNDVFTSFVGYFPAENPQVLMMVVVDSPRVGNAWGSTVAGPIFKNIAMQTVGYLGLKPSQAIATAEQNTVNQKPH